MSRIKVQPLKDEIKRLEAYVEDGVPVGESSVFDYLQGMEDAWKLIHGEPIEEVV